MTSEGSRQAPCLEKLLLTPKQAAEALSISERTLYNYTAAGKIKATWLSPQTKRYTPAALDAFIAASTGERGAG